MSARSERVPSRTTAQAESTESPGASRALLGIHWVFPRPVAPVPLVQPRTLIGRDAECAVCLEGDEVSRRHAQVVRQGLVWTLEDLGSTNGTFIDGQPVTEGLLGPGSVVRLGEWVGVTILYPDHGVRYEVLRELAPGISGGHRLISVLDPAVRAATSDLPLVIEGETGTGKECVAKAVHDWSGRNGQYVAVNCAALPESLAESELFGHLRGAFTGAVGDRVGHFRAADHGTLVLDEVADLPATIQAKLLRVLQERSVAPLGASRTIPVDVRVLALAQRPLGLAVEGGQFRADLHARLNGLTVRLPALRERREDVPGLLARFLGSAAGRPVSVDARLVESLCVNDFHGNVRELEILARRLVAVNGPARCLRRSDLPEEYRRGPSPRNSSAPPGQLPARFEPPEQPLEPSPDELVRALHACCGNLTRAAAMVGISRQAAYRICERKALRLEDFRPRRS